MNWRKVEVEMKKFSSLLLALFSTLFLAVGATNAAERFDTLGQTKSTSSGSVMDGPTLPCVTNVVDGPTLPCVTNVVDGPTLPCIVN
jgi:hypothetical protein